MNQLPLGIGLRDSATFSNFYPGANREALLQQQAERGRTVAYLPLAEPGMVPQMLEGMEAMDLLAIDDLQQVAGQAEWETALFHLYNRLRDSGARLVVTATVSPAALPIGLPDLASQAVV